ncbi:MAG: SPOR domain-containing protein [Candidatus Krumholzibacteriia bacterium]
MTRVFPGSLLICALVLVGGSLTLVSFGQSGALEDLFAAGDFRGAREALAVPGQGIDPDTELFWRMRLETRPEMALTLAAGTFTDEPGDRPLELAARLDSAAMEFTRGKFGECLAVLEPVIGHDPRSVPGSAFLWAGLAHRALGRLQQSREMLASVQPGDEAFPLARYYLGDIALDQGDPVLAQRYLEAAREAGGDRIGVLADAARWRALEAQGETDAAAELLAGLRSLPADRLALLDLHLESPGSAAPAGDEEEPGEGEAPPVDDRERYCLQFGAFADRSLALAFVRRHQEALPDLRIERSADETGRNFYKVRSGGFASPVQARNEANLLKSRLGIDVFVVERDAARGSQD